MLVPGNWCPGATGVDHHCTWNPKLFHTGTIMLIFNMENIEMIVNLMDTMFQQKTPKKVILTHHPRSIHKPPWLVDWDWWVANGFYQPFYSLYRLSPENSHGSPKNNPIEQENSLKENLHMTFHCALLSDFGVQNVNFPGWEVELIRSKIPHQSVYHHQYLQI